jgi:hypothetical protein
MTCGSYGKKLEKLPTRGQNTWNKVLNEEHYSFLNL